MFSIGFKNKIVLSLIFTAALFGSVTVFGGENKKALTTANVNFRQEPNKKAEVLRLIIINNEVEVIEENEEWTKVSLGELTGYIQSSYLEVQEPEVKSFNESVVELTPWSEAKQIFTIGQNALVYDVYSGKTYTVRSFSNGHHADVEPVTQEDTNILKSTYGGSWSWDPRPVWVSINGRTMAASINGMPHGGGVNSSNGMNGQICIHFLNSTTHNGNKSFARAHQNALLVAYQYAQNN